MFSSLRAAAESLEYLTTVGIPYDSGLVAGTNSRDYIILLTH